MHFFFLSRNKFSLKNNLYFLKNNRFVELLYKLNEMVSIIPKSDTMYQSV